MALADPPGGPPSDVSTIPYRVGLLETTVLRHGSRIDSLEDWRAELRGAYRLIGVTFGTSLLTGLVALTTLVLLLSGGKS